MADAADSRHDLEQRRAAIPGCGVAVYVALLLSIFVVGIIGLTLATMTILDAGENSSPYDLAYGGSVEPALLYPMEQAGLLAAGEVPDAFHSENLAGDVACAIKGDTFLRLGPEGAQRFPLAAITAAEEVPEGVRVVGPVTVLCTFQAGEGADRFARMLKPR
jgi:hypothetical protein